MRPIALLIITALFITSGCASIFRGDRSKVLFESNPSGAKIIIDDNEVGVTPMTVKMPSRHKYHVTIKKHGYGEEKLYITNEVEVGYVVLDILFGLIPIVFDATSGAWYKIVPDKVYIDFTTPF